MVKLVIQCKQEVRMISWFSGRLKTKLSSKYGLPMQPRLVDIIAGVPQQYKKVVLPKSHIINLICLLNWFKGG